MAQLWWKLFLSAVLQNGRAVGPVSRFAQLATVDHAAGRETGFPRVRTVVFRGVVGVNWKGRDSDRIGAPIVLADSVAEVDLPTAEPTLAGNVALLFAADARSSKIQELAGQSEAEVCWYLPHSREQFRLRGRMHAVGPRGAAAQLPDLPGIKNTVDWASAREQVWRALTPRARRAYLAPPPGSPVQNQPPPSGDGARVQRGSKDVSQSGNDDSVLLQQPHPNFALLVLHPLRVDYYALDQDSSKVDEARNMGEAIPATRTIYEAAIRPDGVEWKSQIVYA